jgi:DNA-binding XRE family transcriptional regulator
MSNILVRPLARANECCRYWEFQEGGSVEARSADGSDSPAVEAALQHVGARLKRVRRQRGMTLTGVAEATGISKSTLSRLETGQRRPTLELLLALSQTYRVPLDDLVGAPEVGDPRIRLRPGRVKAAR